MTFKGIKSAFMRDTQAFRELEPHRRMEFIWDYYKLPILVTASIIVLLLGAVSNIGRGEICLYAVLVNADENVESPVFDELLKLGGAQEDGRTVSVVSNYKLGGEFSEVYDAQTLQVLAAEFSIGDLDLFGANEEVFRSYAELDAFLDLSLFIDKALLERHRENLYTYSNSDGVEIVGGIRLREGSPIHRAGYYSGDVIFGVAARAEHMDEAILLIRQLLEQT